MIKLYKMTDAGKYYWETWNDGTSHTVHWGTLGTKGDSKKVKPTWLKSAERQIQSEIAAKGRDGYRPIEAEAHCTLLIEYAVDGMGGADDLDKRNRLIEKMDNTLGWTGLGHCDGGSMGSGTMEVCCFVVDFENAKSVIVNDLKGTEFANFTRIFDENADA